MFAGNKAENELNTEEISCAIKDLAKGGINSIVFSGGEPLMNADFELFVKLACSLGMEVQVLSNGSLWTDEMIDRLSPYLASVQISIDGYDEESNSRIRGKGNLSKALHTVETLLSKGVKTSVAMVPEWSDKLAENADKYVTFAKELMEKYDGKPFSFNVVGEVWEGRDYRLNSKEKKQLSEIASYILANTMGVNSEDEPFIEYHRRFGIEDNCAYGNLSISANGDVYLCAQIQPLNPIGNIRTSSISSLLSISEQAKVQSEISNLAPCSDCAIRYICGGGCRIKFFSFFNKGILLSDGQQPRRECTDKDKQFMYDLMIRTNEFIFQ
jgi:radical SAM protein with 4Fe4S-binding SPASM domain